MMAKKGVVGRRSWVHDRYKVELPHGTELRIFFRKEERYGSIVDGRFAFGNKRFDSPSRMAVGMAKDISASPGGLNGWAYLWVKRPLDKAWAKLFDR